MLCFVSQNPVNSLEDIIDSGLSCFSYTYSYELKF